MAGEGQRFLGIYFFVAVAGSVLIVFGAPFVPWPVNLPAPVAEAIHWLDQNATLRELSSSLHKALSWQLPPEQLPAEVPTAVQEAAPVPPPTVVPPAPEPAPVAAPAATGMLETVASPPEPEPAPATPSETNRWGVVRSPEAKVYSKQGKFLARVGAGALLDIRDLIEADAGVYALGCVYSPTNSFEEALVATNDLEIRCGAFKDVSANEKDLRGAEARMLAELALHKAGPTRYLRKDNPMLAEYLRTRQEYIEYWKKVRVLQGQLEAAEGPAHMRIEDSLRLMKGEDVRLGQAYEAMKQAFEKWNHAHPEPTGQEKIEVDAITQELARVRSDLDAMASPQP